MRIASFRLVLPLLLLAGCTLLSSHSSGEAASDAAPPDKVPAFPGALGGGEWTTGGRGGKVLEVTSLEDSGPGTLREAIETSGPRTVVFRTGGNIKLKSRLVITSPNITIAGQTAPGGGICISGNSFWINTNDAIVRYLRIRPGFGTGTLTDGLGGRPVKNVIIDHCSCTWAPDENVSVYKQEDKTNTGNPPPSEDLTVQWSLIGETVGHRWRTFGITWGGKNATYHHNLHACNVAWENYASIAYAPAVENLDIRNNVIYAWRKRAIDGGAGGTINFVNNFFIPDPTVKDPAYTLINPATRREPNNRSPMSPNPGKWYVAGNVIDRYPKETADNWLNVQLPRGAELGAVKAAQPFPAAALPEETAAASYEAVLKGAGATLPARDSVDARIVDATKNRTTYYQKQGQDLVPSTFVFPDYAAGTVPADSDHDGMPDAWEKAHGLDANNAADANADADKDGYTNLEECLNGTDPKQRVDYTKPENNRDVVMATPGAM